MPPDRKPSPLLLCLKLALLACVLGMLVLGLSPLYRAFLHLTGLSPQLPPPRVSLVLPRSGHVWLATRVSSCGQSAAPRDQIRNSCLSANLRLSKPPLVPAGGPGAHYHSVLPVRERVA